MRKLKKIARSHAFLLTVSLIYGCASRQEAVQSQTGLSEGQRQHIISTAKNQVGRAYRYGGASPKTGFDCSGLAQYSYSTAGVLIKRDSRSQAQQFTSVSDAKKGDMVFFKINGRTVSHSGIYLGDNKMVHAPSSGGRVEIVSINHPYWKKKFYKFGQI